MVGRLKQVRLRPMVSRLKPIQVGLVWACDRVLCVLCVRVLVSGCGCWFQGGCECWFQGVGAGFIVWVLLISGSWDRPLSAPPWTASRWTALRQTDLRRTAHIFGLSGPSCKTSAAELKRALLRATALETPPNIPRHDPREENKVRNQVWEKGKSAKCWASHPSGPELWALHHQSASHWPKMNWPESVKKMWPASHGPQSQWPKVGLAQVEWASVGLA